MKKELATYFSILAWRYPWTEEPGGLQSTGSQKKSDMNEQLKDNKELEGYASLFGCAENWGKS